MKKLVTIVAALALALTTTESKAGSMVDGGTFGQLSLGANVSIKPNFTYYPTLKTRIGVDRFLFAGSIGGVFAGEQPEQVVGVEGSFQVAAFNMPFQDEGDNGLIFIYILGGVSSEQGQYSISLDQGQWKVGPQIFLDWKPENNVYVEFQLPFMTAKSVNEVGVEEYTVTYFAVEAAVVFEI